MFTRPFWKQTAERVVKTFLQSFAAVLTASGTGLIDAPWTAALSAAGMAALLSVLTSMASVNIGPAQSPSVVGDAPAPAVAPVAPLQIVRADPPAAA